MKNILVPTDFSTCATHAMNMGMALAEHFGATLHFFTSVGDDHNDDNNCNSLNKNSSRRIAFLKNMEGLFLSWKEEAFVRKISVKTAYATEKFLPALQNYVTKNEIDFVVMGSHGHGATKGYYIGSNCQKVVRALHIPIFIIKSAIKKYDFKNVVYASSFEKTERASFQNFLHFISNFSPKSIHLVAINIYDNFSLPTQQMEKNMEAFAKMCPESKCHLHLFQDDFVEVGIRKFADKVNADLVVISNHYRHPIKRIFTGSTVEALIQNCILPVLSIDFAEMEDGLLKEDFLFRNNWTWK